MWFLQLTKPDLVVQGGLAVCLRWVETLALPEGDMLDPYDDVLLVFNTTVSGRWEVMLHVSLIRLLHRL